MPPTITFDEKKHRYGIDNIIVPSVTTILDILNWPAGWWGMTVGVDGVCKLHSWGEYLDFTDPDGIVKLLTAKKLTVNHDPGGAAARGTAVHKALENYMRDEIVPNAADYPVEQRGYIQALARAILHLRPKIIDAEVVVGSRQHMYAGKYDLFAELADGRLARIDAKTSKRIYPEKNYPQLEAYEHAAIECGGQPSDVRMIVRLAEDGDFEVGESYASLDDFLAIKACYDAVQGLKKTGQRLRREAKARLKEAA